MGYSMSIIVIVQDIDVKRIPNKIPEGYIGVQQPSLYYLLEISPRTKFISLLTKIVTFPQYPQCSSLYSPIIFTRCLLQSAIYPIFDSGLKPCEVIQMWDNENNKNK